MISPVACTIENIYVIKSWFRPCVATLQPHHCNPHGFRFQRNENGEAERSIIILRQIPPSKPAKCPTVKEIKDSVEKLRIRMTTAQIEWWEGMAGREAEKREQRCGESLFAEDYGKACGSFD